MGSTIHRAPLVDGGVLLEASDSTEMVRGSISTGMNDVQVVPTTDRHGGAKGLQ